MQKSTVLVKKNDFECILDKIEVQMVSVWSSRLGKTSNTCILLMADFLRISEITHFFEILDKNWKSSIAHAKMVECILFYLNMVAQTQ